MDTVAEALKQGGLFALALLTIGATLALWRHVNTLHKRMEDLQREHALRIEQLQKDRIEDLKLSLAAVGQNKEVVRAVEDLIERVDRVLMHGAAAYEERPVRRPSPHRGGE